MRNFLPNATELKQENKRKSEVKKIEIFVPFVKNLCTSEIYSTQRKKIDENDDCKT